MNTRQQRFLEAVAAGIPSLFETIAHGSTRATLTLGHRQFGPRRVALSLVAEVVDPGANPLATHSIPPPSPPRPATR